METNEETMVAPPEEISLCQNIANLPDQDSSITKIDTDMVTVFCNEISGASTTKRMCNLRDAANRFEQAFLNIERYQGFTKTYEDLMKIFGKMKSDVEFDYFTARLGGLTVDKQCTE